MSAVKVEN